MASVLLAGACMGGPEPVEEGPLAAVVERAQVEAARIRGSAQQLAGLFTSEVGRLQAARAQRNEPHALAAMARLEDLHLALEALDEAQGSLGVAVRYAELRGLLTVEDAARARLDHGADRIATIAAKLHEHTGALVAASQQDVAPLRDGARTEVERDRAALKALRADLGITARLGQ